MNKLISANILDSDFNYNTFKTYFRRLKENKTGPFLKPNFLMPILRYLDGFTYKDLFDEDETNKNEQKNKESSENLVNAFSNQVTELKKALSFLNKDNRSATPREYIKSKDFFASAQKIVEAIGHGINNDDLKINAIACLFFSNTLLERKTWKHGDSLQLSRIDSILRQLLHTSNIYNYNEEGFTASNWQVL